MLVYSTVSGRSVMRCKDYKQQHPQFGLASFLLTVESDERRQSSCTCVNVSRIAKVFTSRKTLAQLARRLEGVFRHL